MGSKSTEIARALNRIAVRSFLFFGAGGHRPVGSRVPFANLQSTLGVDAIWWSFPVGASCAMAMQLAVYRWGNWRSPHAAGGSGGDTVGGYRRSAFAGGGCVCAG